MMHDHHSSLPGYDPQQIWHDGCQECEHRGNTMPRSLGTLDTTNLRRAWDRSRALRAAFWDADAEEALAVSTAERPLLAFMNEAYLVTRALGLLPNDDLDNFVRFPEFWREAVDIVELGFSEFTLDQINARQVAAADWFKDLPTSRRAWHDEAARDLAHDWLASLPR